MPEPTDLAEGLVGQLRQLAALKAALVSPEARPYASIEAFVLAHGRAWEPGPRPTGVKLRRERRCYHNAAMLTLLGQPGRWTYCEGYGLRALVPFPVLHAWVVGADGLAVDVTWRLAPGERAAYFGVPFADDYLARTLIANGVAGLLDRHETRWPLLTGADPASEAVLPWPIPD